MRKNNTDWKTVSIAALLSAIATLLVQQTFDLVKLSTTMEWPAIGAFLTKNPRGQANFIPFAAEIVVAIIFAWRFRVGQNWISFCTFLGAAGLGYLITYFSVLGFHVALGSAQPIFDDIKESPLSSSIWFVCAVGYLIPVLIELVKNGDNGIKRRLHPGRKTR